MGTFFISIASLICFLWCGGTYNALTIFTQPIICLVDQAPTITCTKILRGKTLTAAWQCSLMSVEGGRASKANYCLWSRRWTSGRHLSGIAKWPFCLTLRPGEYVQLYTATLTLGGTLAYRRVHCHTDTGRHASKWNLDSASPHLPL